jgi:23S rRNA pseudouridine1911/1915/1917 synthase
MNTARDTQSCAESAGWQVFVATKPGERLDQALTGALLTVSRSQIQRLIKEGQVQVDNCTVLKPGALLRGDEQLAICLPQSEPEQLVPEPIPLDVVYQDENLLVVNKPTGMVVHPGAGHASGTLANALLAYAPQLADLGDFLRPGIVHRLDQDTSGLIVVALREPARIALKAQFKSRSVRKTYLALVEGCVSPFEGIIDVPVGRSQHRRKRMAPMPDGRPAQTQFRTLERLEDHTLLEVLPHRGRTHQIRVHLAFLGFPVVGDQVYGRRKGPALQVHRQFLHAYELAFCLPGGDRWLAVTAALPDDLQRVLAQLGSRWSSAPTRAILMETKDDSQAEPVAQSGMLLQERKQMTRP